MGRRCRLVGWMWHVDMCSACHVCCAQCGHAGNCEQVSGKHGALRGTLSADTNTRTCRQSFHLAYGVMSTSVSPIPATSSALEKWPRAWPLHTHGCTDTHESTESGKQLGHTLSPYVQLHCMHHSAVCIVWPIADVAMCACLLLCV